MAFARLSADAGQADFGEQSIRWYPNSVPRVKELSIRLVSVSTLNNLMSLV